MFLTFKSYNLLERAFQCVNHKMVISLYLNDSIFYSVKLYSQFIF